MAPNFPHSIFDPLSCTWTQWIVDKVMIKHFLHSVLICDIHTARFQLECSRAAVYSCTLFRVCCCPHSEGCAIGLMYFCCVLAFDVLDCVRRLLGLLLVFFELLRRQIVRSLLSLASLPAPSPVDPATGSKLLALIGNLCLILSASPLIFLNSGSGAFCTLL